MLGTAASCIIRDGEMKLAELTAKIAGLEKEIATKVSELSLLTSQKESIMLSLAISGNSSSAKTLGGLLDLAIHALVYICIFFYSHCISGQLHLGCNMCFETSLVIKTSFPFSFCNRRRKKYSRCCYYSCMRNYSAIYKKKNLFSCDLSSYKCCYLCKKSFNCGYQHLMWRKD